MQAAIARITLSTESDNTGRFSRSLAFQPDAENQPRPEKQLKRKIYARPLLFSFLFFFFSLQFARNAQVLLLSNPSHLIEDNAQRSPSFNSSPCTIVCRVMVLIEMVLWNRVPFHFIFTLNLRLDLFAFEFRPPSSLSNGHVTKMEIQ